MQERQDRSPRARAPRGLERSEPSLRAHSELAISKCMPSLARNRGDTHPWSPRSRRRQHATWRPTPGRASPPSSTFHSGPQYRPHQVLEPEADAGTVRDDSARAQRTGAGRALGAVRPPSGDSATIQFSVQRERRRELRTVSRFLSTCHNRSCGECVSALTAVFASTSAGSSRSCCESGATESSLRARLTSAHIGQSGRKYPRGNIGTV